MKNNMNSTQTAHLFTLLKNGYDKEEREFITASDIVIFSHLRWEFVTQRPQHIATQLSRNHRVFYFEEPLPYDSYGEVPVFNDYATESGIRVIQPHSNLAVDAYDYATLYRVIAEAFSLQSRPVMWFYSPLFVGILRLAKPALVVYDRMDKLDSFKDASPLLTEYERHLLVRSDIVFTGGKSLFEEVKDRHDSVYCFPSSVDANHFSKATDDETIMPSDILEIPKPIVGFYGVIDERFDARLVDGLAKALPNVSFIFIGPVVKIGQETLPRRKNIHYFGTRPYEQLPNYLKAFDIAFIPFAKNKSTEFISPTKTLEYLAACKPILSTPIRDIVRDYQNEIHIIKTVAEGKKAITKLLNETIEEKKLRVEKNMAIIAKTSWEHTVHMMERIMKLKLNQKIDEIVRYKKPIHSLLTPSENMNL